MPFGQPWSQYRQQSRQTDWSTFDSPGFFSGAKKVQNN
jgi:hypothetical protein